MWRLRTRCGTCRKWSGGVGSNRPMESNATLGSQTPEEHEERQAALDRGEPFLLFRDGDGRQRIVALGEGVEAVTIGRRYEADISLPWDPGGLAPARRALAARGRVDDRRRRLVPERHVGQRAAPRRPPAAGRRRPGQDRPHDPRLPLAGRHRPGADDGPGRAQRHAALLRAAAAHPASALCRPLFADGDGFNPSSDLEVADETGIDVDVVTQELDLLARLFGLEDMPRPERRAEVALLAVRSGLVGADEGGTQG